MTHKIYAYIAKKKKRKKKGKTRLEKPKKVKIN